MVDFYSVQKISQIIPVLNASAVENRTNLQLDEFELKSIAEPLEAIESSITFLINESFIQDVLKTKASVLVVNEALINKVKSDLPSTIKVIISCKDAYLAFAKLTEYLASLDPFADWVLPSNAIAGSEWTGGGVNSSISKTSTIDPTVRIGTHVSIGDEVQIGARTILLPNVTIGPKVIIGEDCVLFPGCVLYSKVKIGNRVRLHANTVIGSDGFGYAKGERGAVKIWHLGSVQIHDEVEVGAGTTIDRGTIKDTVIETGVKIDNQVQIGHNGYIGAFSTLCAQVGLAGNVKIGVGTILAGKVGVADKVQIGDGVIVGGGAGVSKDVKNKEVMMGSFLARPRMQWWRMVAQIDKLNEISNRLKKLEGNSK